MPNNKSKQVSRTSHVFRGCRDALQPNTPSSSPATTGLNVTTASNGTTNYSGILCPLGLTSVILVSGVFNNPSSGGNVLPPTLRGFFNKATGFQMYRVTRAKLVFVGSVSSNTTGNITMCGYTDPIDVSSIAYAPLSSGPGTRTFSLASAATKEVSVPIPVDSTWKKVSGDLTTVSNTYPFSGSSAGFIPLATVADLSFGAWAVFVTGASASSVVGSLYVDYDVEFKSPIDSAVNF